MTNTMTAADALTLAASVLPLISDESIRALAADGLSLAASGAVKQLGGIANRISWAIESAEGGYTLTSSSSFAAAACRNAILAALFVGHPNSKGHLASTAEFAAKALAI